MNQSNPIGIRGIGCVEFSAPDEKGFERLHDLFTALGCSPTHQHRKWDATLYTQNGIRFLITKEPGSQAQRFTQEHGPCISAMAWLVDDAEHAIKEAVKRGASCATDSGPFGQAPGIIGIGGSIIYFVESPWLNTFDKLADVEPVPSRGFTSIDHLTNNVEKGTMEKWVRYYKDIFGFTEVRTFDIRGDKTGLTSYALRSPDGSFCIPINEGSEEKSQIEEYLREYKGPGIQHLALASNDLLRSLDGLAQSGVEMLDIDNDYYQTVFDRVPNVREDHARIEKLQVLVDGDEEGYLLQIFTKNVIGPIFFEMIQRRNHLSFGEGNFGALFRSIERDQERRGTI